MSRVNAPGRSPLRPFCEPALLSARKRGRPERRSLHRASLFGSGFLAARLPPLPISSIGDPGWCAIRLGLRILCELARRYPGIVQARADSPQVSLSALPAPARLAIGASCLVVPRSAPVICLEGGGVPYSWMVVACPSRVPWRA